MENCVNSFFHKKLKKENKNNETLCSQEAEMQHTVIIFSYQSQMLQCATKLASQVLHRLWQIRQAICPSHSGIVSKQWNAEQRGIHHWVAQCL